MNAANTPSLAQGDQFGPSGEEPTMISMGLIRIGQLELAVPTQFLREAIDLPKKLSPLPSDKAAVRGAVDVRGDLIPVLDLRAPLGLTQEDAAQGRIIVIQYEGYLFGVVADLLGEVVTLSTSQCHDVAMLNASAKPLIRQLFSLDEGRRVVSVLCLEGISHQLDMPLTRPRASTALTGSHKARTQQSWSPYVLFECGQTKLAINADLVDTVVNLDGLGTSLHPNSACLGVLHTETRKLAVLDGLALLGLGTADLATNRQVLVLKVGGDSVGLLIRQVSRIARLDDASNKPVPALAFDNPHFFEGMLPLPEVGEFLKIAAKPLLARTEITSMASIHGRPATSAAERAQQKLELRRSDSYLTFKVGTELATPLKHVREILPMPANIMPIDRPGDPRIGLFTHRDQIMPIIDMGRLLGAEPEPGTHEQRLLLVDGQHGTLAFLVERVYAIETAQWEHAPIAQGQLRSLDELHAALKTRSLLTLGQDSKRGVGAVDMPRIARAIEAHHAPAPVLDAAA